MIEDNPKKYRATLKKDTSERINKLQAMREQERIGMGDLKQAEYEQDSYQDPKLGMGDLKQSESEDQQPGFFERKPTRNDLQDIYQSPQDKTQAPVYDYKRLDDKPILKKIYKDRTKVKSDEPSFPIAPAVETPGGSIVPKESFNQELSDQESQLQREYINKIDSGEIQLPFYVKMLPAQQQLQWVGAAYNNNPVFSALASLQEPLIHLENVLRSGTDKIFGTKLGTLQSPSLTPEDADDEMLNHGVSLAIDLIPLSASIRGSNLLLKGIKSPYLRHMLSSALGFTINSQPELLDNLTSGKMNLKDYAIKNAETFGTGLAFGFLPQGTKMRYDIPYQAIVPTMVPALTNIIQGKEIDDKELISSMVTNVVLSLVMSGQLPKDLKVEEFSGQLKKELSGYRNEQITPDLVEQKIAGLLGPAKQESFQEIPFIDRESKTIEKVRVPDSSEIVVNEKGEAEVRQKAKPQGMLPPITLTEEQVQTLRNRGMTDEEIKAARENLNSVPYPEQSHIWNEGRTVSGLLEQPKADFEVDQSGVAKQKQERESESMLPPVKLTEEQITDFRNRGMSDEEIAAAQEKLNIIPENKTSKPHEENIQKGKVPAKVLKREKKNSSTVYSLSFLSPQGRTISALKSLSSTNLENKTVIEKIASYIGEARKGLDKLTDKHEDEMFQYLMKPENMDKFKNKTEFVDRIDKVVNRLDFKPEQILNLENKIHKSSAEQVYERRLSELQKELKDAKDKLDERRKYFTGKGLTGDELTDKLKNYEEVVRLVQKDVTDFENNKDAVKKAESEEVDLFGGDPSLQKAIKENRKQIHTEPFKNWFGDWENDPENSSKVVDEKGKPLVVYSGHSNVQAFEKFDKKKSIAGGFYFSEDPGISSSYSLGKFGDYRYPDESSFRIKNSRGEYKTSLQNYELSEKQRKIIDELKQREIDTEGEEGFHFNDMEDYIKHHSDYDAQVRRWKYNGGIYNLRNIYEFNEMMGYNIAYAKEGTEPLFLRQTKSDTADILDALGIDYHDAMWEQPGVLPVYLDIKNPLDADKPFPQDLLDALKQKAKHERRNKLSEYGNQRWTKDYSLRDWVDEIEKGESEYWTTQIPKSALPILKQFGYDGIKERGSKASDKPREERQINWVAFEPTQVKSAIGNRGTFDRSKEDINLQKSVESGVNSISNRVNELAKARELLSKSFPEQKIVFLNDSDMRKMMKVFGKNVDTALGVSHEGTVYFNKDLANASTPFHEIGGHIFNRIIAKTNPGLWEIGKKIALNSKEYVERTKADYPELSGDRFADEVLAQAVGDNGESLVKSLISEGNQKEANRFKQWIKKYWEAVKNLFRKEKGIESLNENSTIQDWVNVINKEIAKGKKLTDSPVQPGTQTEMMFQKEQTKSPEFKKWFGESKVVDENGEPRVVYHGTHKPTDFKKFKIPAFFSVDPVDAEWYATERFDSKDKDYVATNPRIYPAHLSIQKPIDFVQNRLDALDELDTHELNEYLPEDLRGFHYKQKEYEAKPLWEYLDDKHFIEYVKSKGYDGYIIKEGGQLNYATLSPSQIKSAISNKGTFDSDNPNMMLQKDKKSDYMSEVSKKIEEFTDDLRKQGFKGEALRNRVSIETTRHLFNDDPEFKKFPPAQKREIMREVRRLFKDQYRKESHYTVDGFEYVEKGFRDKFWNRGIKQSLNVVREMGTPGKEFADRMEQKADDERALMGKAEGVIIDIASLSKPEYENLTHIWTAKMNELKAPEPINENVARIEKSIDKYFDDIAGMLKERGFTTTNKKTGDIYSFTPKVDYRPRMLNTRVDKLGITWDAKGEPIYNKEREKVLDYLVETKQANDLAQASILLDEQLSKNRVFKAGNVEYSRLQDIRLPDEYYIRDPKESFIKYAKRVSKRIAFVDNWGMDGSIEKRLLDDMRKEHRNFKFAEELFRYDNDQLTQSERDALKTVNSIKGLQALTKFTPFTTLRNSVQGFLGTTTRGNLLAGIKSIYKSMDPVMRRYARESGALADSIENYINESFAGDEKSPVGKLTGKYLDLIQFTRTDRSNRIISAIGGLEFMKDMLKRVQKDSVLKKRALREFDKMGLNIDDALKRGGFTKAEENKIMRQFAYETQFGVRAKDLPLFWSSPYGKLVTQWKPFGYKMTQLIRDSILGELKQGNVFPLITYMVAYGVTGEAVNYIIDTVRGKLNFNPKGDDKRDANEQSLIGRAKEGDIPGFIERYVEDLAGLGALSFAVDIGRSMGYDKSGVEKMMLGPALSEIAQSFGDIAGPLAVKTFGYAEDEQWKDTLRKTLSGITKTAIRNLPGSGLLRTFGITKRVQDMLFPPKSKSKDQFDETLSEGQDKDEYAKIKALERERDDAKKQALESRDENDIKKYRELDKELNKLRDKSKVWRDRNKFQNTKEREEKKVLHY